MTWILIVVITYSGHGATSEQFSFQTERACERFGQQVKDWKPAGPWIGAHYRCFLKED